MTKLANDLIEAKALIADPKEWCKGIDPKGRSRCAMYAIADVAAPDIRGTRYSAMERALHAALPLGFRKEEADGFHRVVRFNDHDQTSHADVMAMFDRAIKRAQRASA